MAVTDRLLGTDLALAFKAPTVVATTGANITLSSTQVIDGIAVGTQNERVLVKDQTGSTDNGIYISSSDTWTRAADCDGARDLVPGSLVYVDRGTQNSDTLWVFNSSSTATSVAISSDPKTLTNVTPTITNTSGGSVTATGSTAARTLADRFAEVANVKDYGATGDGTTDDRAAIAAADTASGGEAVLFPSGSYSVQSDITISNPVIFLPGATLKIATTKTVTFSDVIVAGNHQIFDLQGTGVADIEQAYNAEIPVLWYGTTVDETTLQAAVNAAADATGASDGGTVIIPIGVHDIDTSSGAINVGGACTIIGGGAQGTTSGTVLKKTSAANHLFSVTGSGGYIRFADFTIRSPGVTQNAGTAGIFVDESSSGSSTAHLTIERLRIEAMYVAIQLRDAISPYIANNLIIDFTYAGILIENDADRDLPSGLITGNKLWDVGGAAGAEAGIWLEKGNGLKVSNNRILGAMKTGVYVGFNSSTGDTGNLIIEGNHIDAFTEYGVKVQRVSGTDDYTSVSIQGNNFGLSQSGVLGAIYMVGTAGADYIDNLSVIGNMIANNQVTSSVIRIDAGEYFTVANNTIWNFGSGDAGIVVGSKPASGLVANNNVESATTKYPTSGADWSNAVIVDLMGDTFANLVGAANGSLMYISDGTAGTPMTGSGTGSLGVRLNGAWKGL